MKALLNLLFGPRSKELKPELKLAENHSRKNNWIFVDKGNYLVRSIPFSL